MIVVADTTPLNYLVLLGKIELLNVLYGSIFIPHAVHDEMLHSLTPEQVRSWAQNPPGWLHIISPTNFRAAIPELDIGESEAISLAEELGADWILIDEAAGRDEATKRGLQTVRTLGILRQAHRSGLLQLRPTLDALRQNGFHVSQNLIDLLLDSVEP